ncbi:hypothetical protein FACS1894156_3590 [Bacteroidia bacterium]|nr:hypothetical protein FACS1894156_3590 [Bacteroidia bacterium]
MKKIFLLWLALQCSVSLVQAQYHVELKRTGAGAGTVFLLRYTHNGAAVLLDSVRANSKGAATFASKQNVLASGMYVVAAGEQEIYFLASGKPNFKLTIEADINNRQTPVYKNSKENEDFGRFFRLQNETAAQLQALQQHYAAYNKNQDSLWVMEQKINALRTQQTQQNSQIAAQNEGTLLYSMIRALQDPEVPSVEIPNNAANPDSVRWEGIVKYAKNHFFDLVDFNDNRLIYTPVLGMRLSLFFQQILRFEPAGAIIDAVNKLLAKVKNNPEMYRYVLTWLYQRYNSSPIEGHYAVGKVLTDYMADSTVVNWLTAGEEQELQKNLKRYALNPVGSIAADLVLRTPSGELKSLHCVEAPYTVLYFYNPGCHTCKETTPLVHNILQYYKDKGLKVFAVYPDREKAEWETYISENHYGDFINVWDADELAGIYEKYSLYAIPQIYVLDEHKKILHKDVSVEDLQSILFFLLGRN